jgi:hypothetical protein
MYTKEIFMLISWPVTMYITYLLIRYFLKVLDKKIQS